MGTAGAGHPVFAAFCDFLTAGAERGPLAPLRRNLVDGLHGAVLDVGAGTGANFPFLAVRSLAEPSLAVYAADPDPHMLCRARRRADRLGLRVTFLEAPAEALPLADASMDAVLLTLVLCTAGAPEAALAEVRRVLRPGGSLRFLEHVRAEGAAGRWQQRLAAPWAAVAGGCRLDRCTGDTLARAGFASLDWKEVPAPFPVLRVIAGSARKAG